MDWKTLAAVAGLGAGALWYARSKKEEELFANQEPATYSRKLSGTGDEGMPWNTPYPVQRLYRFMIRSAKSKKMFGEGAGSIYWTKEGSKWSIGDNGDRLEFIIYDDDNDSYVHRTYLGDQRLSRKNAEALAKSFFQYIEEYLPVPYDEDEEDLGFA